MHTLCSGKLSLERLEPVQRLLCAVWKPISHRPVEFGGRVVILCTFALKVVADRSVVLMDELDQLLTAKQDVVYNFFNWPTMRDSQLFVVAVANRMDLPQQLAAKVKSRLGRLTAQPSLQSGLQTVLFPPYDKANLIEIVKSRLIPHPKNPDGLYEVLTNDAITLAATKMAGTNGDARRVLDACRCVPYVELADVSAEQWKSQWSEKHRTRSLFVRCSRYSL